MLIAGPSRHLWKIKNVSLIFSLVWHRLISRPAAAAAAAAPPSLNTNASPLRLFLQMSSAATAEKEHCFAKNVSQKYLSRFRETMSIHSVPGGVGLLFLWGGYFFIYCGRGLN